MRTLKSPADEMAKCDIRQTEALRRTDGGTGNQWARRCVRVWKQLRATGDEGREALAVLFTHERNDVRVMAAAYLLRYKHDEATRVLEDVAKNGHGLAAFGAEQCLKRWEEGDWHLDDD